MYLLQITIEMRIIIGILAMGLLFVSFIIAFVTIQRRKMEYQKSLQSMLEQKQEILASQNLVLEQKVKERTAELNEQKEVLQASLAELKATQQQLVQSEKMASLGEMTAGIAHEIQNPLNFINNFSEVSIELFEEMEIEMAKDNTEEVQSLSAELKENLRKINHHSQRADKIVKAMLEHSRATSGKKELTNLNDLMEEGLKLSAHAFRNKYREAEITCRFEADPHLPPVLVIPQDLSRVVLNICNNALYTLFQKQLRQKEQDFKPSLVVSTRLSGRQVLVKIADNGLGIPSNVMPKIFQPFFTTKPSGEGTGLGLSLSYDIITKVHGGNLQVESVEGEGTTFTITLPLP